MTTDEILARYGLIIEDVALIGYNQKWNEEGTVILNSRWHDSDYAFVIENNEPLLSAILLRGAEIIAYYPDPGTYLVKRKHRMKNGSFERLVQFNSAAKYREAHPEEYPLKCQGCKCRFNSDEYSPEFGACLRCVDRAKGAREFYKLVEWKKDHQARVNEWVKENVSYPLRVLADMDCDNTNDTFLYTPMGRINID